jgi:hypothetical protein
MVLLLATISAALALALNILLNIRQPTKQSGILTLIGVWLCVTVVCMMPSGGQNALLATVIACFALYTVFPYDIMWSILVAFGLSLTQIAVFILLPTDPFTVDQVSVFAQNSINFALSTFLPAISGAIFAAIKF